MGRFFALLLVVIVEAGFCAPRDATAAGRARGEAVTALMVTSTNDSGPGTVRQALIAANGSPEADSIAFAIPGAGPHVIALQSALPTVTSPVVIDGFTEPGASPGSPTIVLDGALVAADGLVVEAGSSTVRGLVVQRFGGNGIVLRTGSGNVVEGNFVGTDVTGVYPAGNAGAGVLVDNSTGNRIGGVANTIAFNGGDGVSVLAGLSNAVQNNAVHSNAGLGIDLAPDGPTANDVGDGDGGPNGLQNAPQLVFVESFGSVVHVDGFLTSVPQRIYRVEFYTSHVSDPSGTGEGERRIAFVDLDTGQSGTIGFGIDLVQPDPGARFITATATDPSNNTSEFSNVKHYELPPRGSDTAGVVVPATGAWFLKNTNAPGPADAAFVYGPANAGFVAIDGDWDGDGDDSPGLYDPVTGAFFLKNTNAPGPADLVFTFGAGGQGYAPVVGDWNGDGTDTVGLYAPSSGVFFLTNANAAGPAHLVFGFGPPASGWVPLAGDWDGDDVDTVGLYAPATGTFFLRNAHAPGAADLAFAYGVAGAGWSPVVGDFDDDGDDTVGVYAPTTGAFFLKNTNEPGAADLVFSYGPTGATPLAGNWDGL